MNLDDGSGSVTILEAYRALIAADFRPAKTVEFHWYSAEVCFLVRGVLAHLTSAKGRWVTWFSSSRSRLCSSQRKRCRNEPGGITR